jgi:Type II secretion system (T2SS), protein M
MTARDRIIVVVALVAVAIGAFWFLSLAPKRKDARELQGQIEAARQQLTTAQQSAAQARKAQARYDLDYAEIADLGKAVPQTDALPSLLYQLQSAAHGARIRFGSLKIASAGGGGVSPSGKSSSGSAAATQAASSTLPPGATVGSAGFPTMPFSFVFDGSFFDMQRFLRDVQRFVRVNSNHVDVRGRLLSIDGFSLSAGPEGFPSVTANVTATAYLQAPDSGGGSGTSPSPSSSANGTGSNSGGTGTGAPAAAMTAGAIR